MPVIREVNSARLVALTDTIDRERTLYLFVCRDPETGRDVCMGCFSASDDVQATYNGIQKAEE
jgi:hypothetical protein